MDNLSDILRDEARGLGLCDKWYAEWGDCNQQELIEKYKRGIDFIIKNRDWPSNDFIKASFDSDLLHRNLIFTDEEINVRDAPSGIYIINGSCSGTLWFNSWAAATVYVRHDSRITVVADDFAKVSVRLYDDSDAEVIDMDDSVVRVFDRR